MGLKERPPPKAPEPGVASPTHRREMAEISPVCLTQLIAVEQQQVQEQERVKHPSKEWSPNPHRGALSSCLLTEALCDCSLSNLLVPTEGVSCMRDPLTEPPKVAPSQHCICQSPHAEVQQQENVFGKHFFFTNSSNLEDKAPSLSPALERESRHPRHCPPPYCEGTVLNPPGPGRNH